MLALSSLGALGCLNSKAQNPISIATATGLRLTVAHNSTLPTLLVDLPGDPGPDSSIEILFPEHVTVREHDKAEAVHLYRWRPGVQPNAPQWRQAGQSFEYTMDLGNGIHMMARVTIEDDGVRYHFRFENGSKMDYDMIEAVWDPRMYRSRFRDLRLERTYVHRQGGFELIASDLPARLSMPAKQWLPCRYLDAYTWPVPPPGQRVRKDEDGITYYNASRRTDQPCIATLSQDKTWVAATCNPRTGNVWTNPELTCHHTDPEVPLKAAGSAEWEGKTYLFKGTLDQVLEKVKQDPADPGTSNHRW